MKRFLCILCLLLALLCVLIACGEEEPSAAGNGENDEQTSAPQTVSVSDVALDHSALSLNVGDTQGLVAAIAPVDATDKTVRWASSDASVATVESGTVTAVGAGTATITATATNGKSASCTVTVAPNAIGFKTLTVDGITVSGKVSHATAIFSFPTEISVSGNATFEVFCDPLCAQPLENKTASLAVGDNTFYVLEYVGGEKTARYTVTVRRKPLYTVTFHTNGGNGVPSQQIEEGGAVTVPDDPTKAGYTFGGWSRDLTLPITNAVTVDAVWVANTDTAYVVKHYVERLDGGYALKDTDNLTGTTDTEVTPATKNYTGFTAPTAQTVTILPDGTRVVEYQYTRNSYTVTFVTNGGNAIATQSLKFEASLPDAVRTGFTFGGWFEKASLSTVVEAVPAQNMSLYAYWTEETKPTVFTYGVNSGGTGSVTIMGYKTSVTRLCIPAYIGGVPVTQINGSAFSGCNTLVEVTVPATVTLIGQNAFYGCQSIEKMTLPFVGAHANASSYQAHFGYIFGYTRTAASVAHYEDYKYHIPANLTKIVITDATAVAPQAFRNCSGITDVTLPASVISIGAKAFEGCSALASVTLGNTSGWWYASFSVDTSGTAISATDLADTSTAARYLTSTYCSYYWKRS